MRYSGITLYVLSLVQVFHIYTKWNRTTIQYKLCSVITRLDKVNSQYDNFRITFHPSKSLLVFNVCVQRFITHVCIVCPYVMVF